MRKIFLATLFLPLVLVIAWISNFAYRMNYICDVGNHIIRSEADAIETGKGRILQARYGAFDDLAKKPEFVDFSPTSDCCTAARTVTILGVIVWKVILQGETTREPMKRYVSAEMALSNCGVVIKDEYFMTAHTSR